MTDFIVFQDRPSDSAVIQRVWRSHSEKAGPFRSMAACSWGMVVSRLKGKTVLTVRGPETKATMADCPADGEWIGVHFKLGAYMPALLPGRLRNRNDVNLPAASSRTFHLDGSSWEFPTFENIETFVQRLVRKGLIATDQCVAATLRGETLEFSRRTVQRHFVHATGMTPKTIVQIERARHAADLLRRAAPILDVVHRLGYFDQAHLTRSLKHFVGQTPALVARGNEQLSLLYNTHQAESVILHAGIH
jgi:AraC-like DNA-binding protein